MSAQERHHRGPGPAPGPDSQRLTGAGRGAHYPSEIPGPGWRDVLVRVHRGVGGNSLGALSAATAYYGFLALPAGFSAGIAFCGLMLDLRQVESRLALLEGRVAPQALDMIVDQFRFLVSQPRGTLALSFALSLSVALWSAMSAVRTMMTALNAAYGERESRGMVRYIAVLALTTAAAIMFVAAALGLIVLLPIAVEWLPPDSSWRTIIVALRWPTLVLLFGVGLALAYQEAPSRRAPMWRWVSWGTVAAVLVWLAASALFAFYAAHFISYERIYGSLAGVAMLLLWLYASAFAVALGAQINAEIERQAMSGPERLGQ